MLHVYKFVVCTQLKLLDFAINNIIYYTNFNFLQHYKMHIIYKINFNFSLFYMYIMYLSYSFSALVHWFFFVRRCKKNHYNYFILHFIQCWCQFLQLIYFLFGSILMHFAKYYSYMLWYSLKNPFFLLQCPPVSTCIVWSFAIITMSFFKCINNSMQQHNYVCV